MADFSITVHEESKFSLDHDNRKQISRNVDPSRIDQNISYEGNISMEEFYERTFQKAYEEHIQKQIKSGHGNRVKDWPEKYYDYVLQKQAEGELELKKASAYTHQKLLTKKESFTKVAKQMIIQIGNTDVLEKMEPSQ